MLNKYRTEIIYLNWWKINVNIIGLQFGHYQLWSGVMGLVSGQCRWGRAVYHLYHVRMSSEQWHHHRRSQASSPVSPWPRVLARAAPSNLGPLHPRHSWWWPPCSRCGWWQGWTPAGAAWPRWRRLVAAVMWLHQLCCPARSYYSHCTTVPHCTLYHCHCTIHHFGGYFIFNSKAEPQYLLERIL